MKEPKLTVHEKDTLCKTYAFEGWGFWEPSLFELSILERLHDLALVEVIDDRWVATEKGSWLVVCWMGDE